MYNQLKQSQWYQRLIYFHIYRYYWGEFRVESGLIKYYHCIIISSLYFLSSWPSVTHKAKQNQTQIRVSVSAPPLWLIAKMMMTHNMLVPSVYCKRRFFLTRHIWLEWPNKIQRVANKWHNLHGSWISHVKSLFVCWFWVSLSRKTLAIIIYIIVWKGLSVVNDEYKLKNTLPCGFITKLVLSILTCVSIRSILRMT